MQEKNKLGQTLDEFLKAYDETKFKRPSLTADIVIMTSNKEILLINRKDHPCINQWCLPGGFVNMDETTHDAARRELKEETGLDLKVLSPIGFYSQPLRDPRTRIVTRTYLAIVDKNKVNVCAGDDAQDAMFFDMEIEKGKEIELANVNVQKVNELLLPCTAEGEPMPQKLTEFVMRFCCKENELSLVSKVGSDGVVDVLLPNESKERSIAFDHGFAIFNAAKKLGVCSF